MKLILLCLMLFVVTSPGIAQKSPSEQQAQLQKEMEELKRKLNEEMKALQESIGSMQRKLEESEKSGPGNFDWAFKLHIPEEDMVEPYLHDFDEYLKEYELQVPHWQYHLQIPGAPEIPELPCIPAVPEHHEFELWSPHGDHHDNLHLYPYHWNWELTIPEIPEYKYEKHKHNHESEEFLEMLPFYNMFHE